MDLLTYYSDLAVAYPEYITQKQFCEVCGICHKTAYNLTRRGEISYEILDTPLPGVFITLSSQMHLPIFTKRIRFMEMMKM